MAPAAWKDALFLPERSVPLTFMGGLRHPVGPAYVCGLHHHRPVEIVYHPVGRGVTRLGGHALAFEEGSFVVYAPSEPHDQLMSTAGEDLCVQIELTARQATRLKAGLYLARLDVPWIIEEMQQLCRAALPLAPAEKCILDLRATAVLLGIVQAACARSENSATSLGARRARQAEDFINEHFATIGSLQEVAAHVGVSHDHLRHLFKKNRGRSMISCLNEARVGHAKLLLRRSALPLKQIASLCGFRDEYYLSAVFRKRVALPPGAYRERTRSN